MHPIIRAIHAYDAADAANAAGTATHTMHTITTLLDRGVAMVVGMGIGMGVHCVRGMHWVHRRLRITRAVHCIVIVL